MKKLLLPIGSVLGLFIFSMLFFLYQNGMLATKAPFLRAASGYAAPDSLDASLEDKDDDMPEDRQGKTQESEKIPAKEIEVAKVPDSSPEDASPPIPAPVAQTPSPVTAAKNASMLKNETTPGDSPTSKDAEGPADILRFDPAKMARLVRVYEKMRPKQVGLILDTMPDEQSVAILKSMKDRAAAQVMASMLPTKAARMSQLLVERGDKK